METHSPQKNETFMMGNVATVLEPVDSAPPGHFPYPCGEYRVIRITPSDGESMKFLPKLHIRALEFCEKYGADTDPVWLTQILYNNFKNPQTENLLHILIAVDASDQIVAHTISYVESYQKLGAVVTQMQFEIDKSVEKPTKDQLRLYGFNLIKEWAHSLKLKTIIANLMSPAMARLAKVGNFYQYRVVVRLDLGG